MILSAGVLLSIVESFCNDLITVAILLSFCHIAILLHIAVRLIMLKNKYELYIFIEKSVFY